MPAAPSSLSVPGCHQSISGTAIVECTRPKLCKRMIFALVGNQLGIVNICSRNQLVDIFYVSKPRKHFTWLHG